MGGGKMYHTLARLVVISVVWGATMATSPVRAQTLLQDLDPGSLTEGIFVDMIYSPERNADQKGKVLAKETQKNKNLKLKSNKKS